MDKQAKALHDAGILREAAAQYRVVEGQCPGHVNELLPIPSVSSPLDPWGREYLLQCDDQSTAVGTYGADGVAGGAGANSDVFVRH